LAVIGALAMLVVGLTLLAGRMGPLGFVTYWMICFALVCVALLMALFDMRAVQDRTREEHKKLLETTIQEIEAEARNKRRRNGRNDQRGNK
jgi:hypothetical protein